MDAAFCFGFTPNLWGLNIQNQVGATGSVLEAWVRKSWSEAQGTVNLNPVRIETLC